MLSNEWWIFHLTKNGWVEGDYKHNFQKEMKSIIPKGILLSRKYFESLGHPNILMERGVENLGAISPNIAELLKVFPHPIGFERFRNTVF
jgi:hypothetical protein